VFDFDFITKFEAAFLGVGWLWGGEDEEIALHA
jgi:hypothetical protein